MFVHIVRKLFITNNICLIKTLVSHILLHNKPKAEVHSGHKLTGPKKKKKESKFLEDK
jgi:hypothetical protein